jgi:hypothetical protein
LQALIDGGGVLPCPGVVADADGLYCAYGFSSNQYQRGRVSSTSVVNEMGISLAIASVSAWLSSNEKLAARR